MARLGYSEYMELGLKFDRIKTELDSMKKHRARLHFNGNNYGSDPKTGIIYDLRILEDNIKRHERELMELGGKIEDNK